MHEEREGATQFANMEFLILGEWGHAQGEPDDSGSFLVGWMP